MDGEELNSIAQEQEYKWTTISRSYADNDIYSVGIDPIESIPSVGKSFTDAYQKYTELIKEPWQPKRASDKSPKSIRPKRGLSMDQKLRNAEVGYNLKDEYTLQECLDAFENLYQKQIGDIYLTGSVALWLQGKITRCLFKDLDIIVVGEYMLDDDIYDNTYGCKYPPDPSGVERKPLAFNDVKIDLFSNIDYINSVKIEYNGKTYVCQDYKDIIKAKLRMVLPKVKDLDELLQTSFEIIYK